MKNTRSILLALAVAALAVVAAATLALGGCDKDGQAKSEAAKGEPTAAAVSKEAPAAAEAPKVEPAAVKVAEPAAAKVAEPATSAGHAEEGGCGAETAGPGPGAEAVPAGQTPLGQPILHAGPDFTDVPEVAVEELLSNPDAYAGKTVQVTGDVSAMCQHRRGWFAVVAGDKSGQQLRVLTMPTFYVPAGSIGRTARAEGTVEVIEVPAQHAKHLMKEHKLGEPGEVAGATMKQVILRAKSADFIEVAAR